MKEKILKYLNDIVSEISESYIPRIKIEKYGYENFFSYGKISYAQNLGCELIKNNISFDSLFDIGYGKLDEKNKKDKFLKSFAEVCKKTPNHYFLKNILSSTTQKTILLKTIEKFDFDICLGEQTKTNSILRILDDFRSIGVDKTIINDELINIVNIYAEKNSDLHPNIIISFIHDDFFFDDDFMNNKFKNMFRDTFRIDSDKEFDKLYCNNNENRIKSSYNSINISLPSKEGKSNQKRKI